MAELNRPKLLSATEAPKLTLERKDNDDPRRETPIIEKEEPTRANPRIDKLEPLLP